jgi:hypothetical protein
MTKRQGIIIIFIATLMWWLTGSPSWGETVVDVSETHIGEEAWTTIEGDVVVGGTETRTSRVFMKKTVIKGTLYVRQAYRAVFEDLIILSGDRPAIVVDGGSLGALFNRVQIITSTQAPYAIVVDNGNGTVLQDVEINGGADIGVQVSWVDTLSLRSVSTENNRISICLCPLAGKSVSNVQITGGFFDRILGVGLQISATDGPVHRVQLLNGWFGITTPTSVAIMTQGTVIDFKQVNAVYDGPGRRRLTR